MSNEPDSRHVIKIYGRNITFIDLHFASALIMQKFTALDVTACKTLKYLKCPDCEIEKLDLSRNLKLRYLDYSDVCLEKLDLANNNNLVFLKCDNCGLATLNVTTSPALTHLIWRVSKW